MVDGERGERDVQSLGSAWQCWSMEWPWWDLPGDYLTYIHTIPESLQKGQGVFCQPHHHHLEGLHLAMMYHMAIGLLPARGFLP